MSGRASGGKCQASKDCRGLDPRETHSPGAGKRQLVAAMVMSAKTETTCWHQCETDQNQKYQVRWIYCARDMIITAPPQTSATITEPGDVSPPGRGGPGCQVPSRRSGPF